MSNAKAIRKALENAGHEILDFDCMFGDEASALTVKENAVYIWGCVDENLINFDSDYLAIDAAEEVIRYDYESVEPTTEVLVDCSGDKPEWIEFNSNQDAKYFAKLMLQRV